METSLPPLWNRRAVALLVLFLFLATAGVVTVWIPEFRNDSVAGK